MTRNEMIIEDRKNKMKYEQIAEKYGLSEDYVRKICGSKCKRIGGVLQAIEVKNDIHNILW